jgi:hypothetical protein
LSGGWKGGALQAAEKRFPSVILSGAKNLALRIFMNTGSSSSPFHVTGAPIEEGKASKYVSAYNAKTLFS